MTRTFTPGQRIITKGDPATVAYTITRGSVRVFLEKDGKNVTIATLKTGALFGETALFDGSEYGAHVEALVDTELAVITPAEFQDKIATCDPMIKSIITMLLERQKRTNEALLRSETREFMDIAFV
jgi:CRP-like cAMP-binding protein